MNTGGGRPTRSSAMTRRCLTDVDMTVDAAAVAAAGGNDDDVRDDVTRGLTPVRRTPCRHGTSRSSRQATSPSARWC